MLPRLTTCEKAVIGLSILCYGSLVAYVHLTRFQVLVSDFHMYYGWSNAWWDFSLRTPSHVPLYSILLWAVRSATFHRLAPATVMHLLALPFVAGAYFYVYRILRSHFPAARNVGFAAFGLYPFVGYCFAFAPADPLAIFFLVAAAYYSLERKWRWFALCVGAGLISHKAAWPFFALLALEAVGRKKCPWYWSLIAGVPLLTFWLWGVYEEHDALWILRDNIRGEFAARTALPILNNLLGPAWHLANAARLARTCLVLALFFLAAYLLAWDLRRWRQADAGVLLALLLSILLLTVLLNEYEIWAAFRFGRVIAIPLAAFLVEKERLRRFLERPACFCCSAAIFLATNFFYAYYFMWIYFRTHAEG
jgi:hypothetical protein